MSRTRYLLTHQVAEIYHVHVQTVRRWIHEGKLEAIVSPGGRGYLIPNSEIEPKKTLAKPLANEHFK